jgi:hypothetical protein
LAARSEKFFKKVTRPLINWSRDRLGSRRPSLFYSAGGVGFRFHVWFRAGVSQLHSGAALTGIGALLILAPDVHSSIAH